MKEKSELPGRKWNEQGKGCWFLSSLASFPAIWIPWLLFYQRTSCSWSWTSLPAGEKGCGWTEDDRKGAARKKGRAKHREREDNREEWIKKLWTLTLWRVTVCCSHIIVSSIAALCRTRQRTKRISIRRANSVHSNIIHISVFGGKVLKCAGQKIF